MIPEDFPAQSIAAKVIAVIPARAGSKGIPGKNLRIVAGKSLLEWSVSAARASHHISRVIVSTDGEEIADEARKCGAEVIMRPPNISGDEASSESALLHVLEELREKNNCEPDILVFLQCTSPLTIAEDIDGTIDILHFENADSALAVVPFHYFIWRQGIDGGWEGINHNKQVRLRRQDRAPEFLESGAVYVMRVEGFRKARHRFFGKTVAYTMPLERHWEIDEPRDLTVSDTLLRLQKGKLLPFQPKAVVFDFDGVMTDNAVWVDQAGTESVRCDRGDGMGIEMLRQAGIPMLILSKERNPVVVARAQKLGLPVMQSIDNKCVELVKWAERIGCILAEVAYVGNDLNDIECLQAVGYGVAVADAHPDVIRVARLVLSRKGGHGSVRELAEIILAKNA